MTTMDNSVKLQEKYNCVLDNEKALTLHVAGEAIEKPQPALWMILIPVFFVFFFFQFNRYKNGLKNFKHDFLRTRQKVLDAVHQAIIDQEEVDINELVATGYAPEQARDAYGLWVSELAVFYRSLFEAEGSDYRSLVQSSYRKKSNYLLAINRLNTVERDLNRALFPDLEEDDDERTTTAVESIEKSCADFRRNQAKEIFSR